VEPELPLRRNRDFVALWVGQTASALGTSISSLAYPLLLLAVTGSPALAGAGATVLAATTFLLRIPAGVVADRVDRKRLMLVCDGGRLMAVGSLGLTAAFGEVHLAHVFLVAVVEGALGVLFAPAETVAVRAVVAPSQVRDAVARNQARQQLASLVGPSLGGALFGLGRGLPFLADALSYAVSFLAVATVRTPLPQGRPSPPGRRLRQELGEGLRWLWRCSPRWGS
jgi:MFS family permease